MTHVNQALFCAVILAFGVAPVAGGCDTTSAGCVDECCGDGIVDPGEACDDGNLVDGDGCSASCTQESCDDLACVGGVDGDRFCDGDLAVSCDDDGSGCLIATTLDCDALGRTCEETAGVVQCVDVTCNDLECVGSVDGDSFCDADIAVDCDEDANGCLIATTQDCDAGGQLCDDTGGAALCVDPTCDDPECVGSTDGASFCQADVAVTCGLSMAGCLMATTLDCAANAEACDDGDGAAVCVCDGCETWSDTGCTADAQCDTGVCWDFADYDPLCGGSTCSIECASHTDCQNAFAAAGAPNAAAVQCGSDGRCDPIGSGFGAFFCQ